MISNELKSLLVDPLTKDYLKQAQRTNCKHLYNFETAMERFGPVVDGQCLITEKCLKCDKIVISYEADERIQEIVNTVLKVGVIVPLEKRYSLEAANFVATEIFCYHELNGEMTIQLNNSDAGKHSMKEIKLYVYPGGHQCSMYFYNRDDLTTFKDTAALKSEDLGMYEDQELFLTVKMKDSPRRYKQFLENLISHNNFNEKSKGWLDRYMACLNKQIQV